MARVCKFMFTIMFVAAALPGMLGSVVKADAAASPQEWELIVPLGEIQKTSINPAPRITGLDGKNIVLRWNGKHNGDHLLNHLAELLSKQYPSANIIKSYELDNFLNTISGNEEYSARITDAIKGMKPDIVIASQAD